MNLKEVQCEVVMVNGRASVLAQDASAHREKMNVLERAEAAVCLGRGLESVRRKEGEPASAVFARLRKRHKIGRK